MSQFPSATPDVPIYPASIRYALAVGNGTLTAYAILTGISIAVCLFALIFISLCSSPVGIWERSSFPTMDFLTKYEIKDEMGQSISDKSLKTLQVLNTRALIVNSARMRVVPSAVPTGDSILNDKIISPKDDNGVQTNNESRLQPGIQDPSVLRRLTL